MTTVTWNIAEKFNAANVTEFRALHAAGRLREIGLVHANGKLEALTPSDAFNAIEAGRNVYADVRNEVKPAPHANTHTTNGMHYGHDANGKQICLGARMGRSERTPTAEPTATKPTSPRFYLRRVRLNNGGYDTGGAYGGTGSPLFEYESEDFGEYLVQGFTRADCREHAKEIVGAKYPGAIFFR